ncbi:MAG: hypothetical protein EHM87_09325 [Burkholderiales bacterium]|nr:MAG: hypothetical protein EHM87_09325 [Burkholderiales bacterium]
MTTRSPDAASSAGHDPLSEPRLEQQVLDLVRNWMRRTRENAAAHTEAAIDRGSFESFPASDPVASATSSSDHAPALGEIDCTLRRNELVFRCAPREPDPERAPPAWTIEGDAGDGSRLRMRVWVEDEAPEGPVPSTLDLEPVHASIRPRQVERRGGVERRVRARAMPGGFDRRHAQRRAIEGARAD